MKYIGKPAGALCWHTGVHGGCALHAEKKTREDLMACDQWECVWLESQKDPVDAMPRSMRPDQCGIMLGPIKREDNGKLLLYVHLSPESPQSYRSGEMGNYIRSLLDRGCGVEYIMGERRWREGECLTLDSQ